MSKFPETRSSEYVPQIIEKYSRNADEMKEKILAFYPCGISQRDILEQIKGKEYERLCDNFSEILSGHRKSVQYEAFGYIINAELKSSMFTFSQDSDERVTTTAMLSGYENEKAIPLSFNGMEVSTEIEEKKAYFTNINK